MKKFIFVLLLSNYICNAQVIVSDDLAYTTSTATTSKAIFDAKSTKAGILLPKVNLLNLTPTVADSPPEGTIAYNISGNVNQEGYYVFIDGKWVGLLNSSTLDNDIPTISSKSVSTYVGVNNQSITLNGSTNITTFNNTFFPTSTANDGGFAVGAGLGSGNYAWKTITGFETSPIVIPDPTKIESRVAIKGSGTVTFSYKTVTNLQVTYAVALFREDSGGTKSLVGSKIYSTVINGLCFYDSFSTNFYDENLVAGSYKYSLAYKYLYTNDNTISITFGDKGGGGCSNLTQFATQQNLVVNLNKIPKILP